MKKENEMVYETVINGIVYRGSKSYIQQIIAEDREARLNLFPRNGELFRLIYWFTLIFIKMKVYLVMQQQGYGEGSEFLAAFSTKEAATRYCGDDESCFIEEAELDAFKFY